MRQKLLPILTFAFFLFIMSGCGSNNGPSNNTENSDGLTANMASIHYLYSLEKHQETTWSQEGGFLNNSDCDKNWFLQLTSLLESAEINSGTLSSDSYHTADNPNHKLTVTYKDGSKRIFNLHLPSSYKTELTLSNTDQVIQFFNDFFSRENPTAAYL